MIKTAKNWFVFLLLSIIVLPNQYSTVCFSRETEAEYGELKIEGTGIKRLVLKRKVGGNETINEPNEVIKLLAGEYSLLESHLENGYIRLGTAIDKWFIVSQDKQAILKVGAPLKQKINAQRQGKFLVLSYELAGLGGDIYTDSTRTKKPAFSIYKGDILVTSGNFEFGWGGTCSYSWRVPIKTFGKLRIVPTADIGELDFQKSEDTIYDWKIYYSTLFLIQWSVLVLALLVPKSNRNKNIILILIPLVMVKIFWAMFMKYANMNSVDAEEFSLIFNSTVIGVTILWLIAGSFTKYSGSLRFLLSFGAVLIISVIGLLSYSAELSREFAVFTGLLAFIVLTILTSIVLSRQWCKGYYKPVRFMLWLALWTIVCSYLAAFVFVIAASIIFWAGPGFSIAAMFIIILAIFVFGLFIYFLNFPYMILGFVNPFFRERFINCLSLNSVLTDVNSNANINDKSLGEHSKKE